MTKFLASFLSARLHHKRSLSIKYVHLERIRQCSLTDMVRNQNSENPDSEGTRLQAQQRRRFPRLVSGRSQRAVGASESLLGDKITLLWLRRPARPSESVQNPQILGRLQRCAWRRAHFEKSGFAVLAHLGNVCVVCTRTVL